jgi:D-beta-D-heptose 7-phosphate kinase/D-beta-D-heptose 1-phosphate adenosyltransferase
MYLPLSTLINISMKIVIVTGGFDPLHSGHLVYFKSAKQLGDLLVVGLNSDQWLTRKKGRPFMPMSERFALVSSIEVVDEVVVYNDDDKSSCDAIRLVKLRYPNAEIIFANGGDRTKENIPEMVFDDVEFVFGVGGENKANSSSWILEEWKKPRTDRPWGHYRVLHEVGPHVKLKELTVMPGQRLSMQRHEKRAEFWFVAEGEATVYTVDPYSTDYDLLASPARHQHTWIRLGEWHQLCNETNQLLKLIEIQYGEDCIEEDIERK